MDKRPNLVKLHRHIGLITGVSIILNGIIGSGIFISPKSVLANTNSIGMCLIFWVICAIVSLFGAFCYSELAIFIPESGSEFIYILRGFSLINKQLGRVVSFLFAWSTTIVLRPSSVAIQSLTCANYLITPIIGNSCGGAAPVLVKICAVLILSIIFFVNAANLKFTNKLLVILAVVKIAALSIVIIGGIYRLSNGYVENFHNSFVGTTTNVLVISQAFYSGLYAYDGWDNLNRLVEELKNPKRNLPLAIFISLSLVTVIYVLANISYFTVMTKGQLLASEVVALTWADSILASKSFNLLISLLISISSFGALLGGVQTSIRFSYIAAREGLHPEILGTIHVKNHTLVPSCLLSYLMSLLYLIPSSISTLLNIFGFATWLFVSLTIIAYIRIRFKYGHKEKALNIPLAVPFVFLVMCLFVTFAPILHKPKIEYLSAIAVILSGLVFYIPLIHFKFKIPLYNKIDTFMRNLLEVRLPDKEN